MAANKRARLSPREVKKADKTLKSSSSNSWLIRIARELERPIKLQPLQLLESKETTS